MRTLRITLYAVGVVQLFFGVLFLAAPTVAARTLHLAPGAPTWANWLFALMGARFIGYGYGMFAAARAPRERVAWIDTMIFIQVVDWVATLGYLAAGLTLRQVSTAAILPPLFIVALLVAHPRRLDRVR